MKFTRLRFYFKFFRFNFQLLLSERFRCRRKIVRRKNISIFLSIFPFISNFPRLWSRYAGYLALSVAFIEKKIFNKNDFLLNVSQLYRFMTGVNDFKPKAINIKSHYSSIITSIVTNGSGNYKTSIT